MKSSKNNLSFYIDDWGLSKEINLATLELSQRGVVAGVSLLSDSPYVDFELGKLLAFERVKIGLHFNLTESNIHWTRLIRKVSLVETEIYRQYKELVERTKRIDYIDGHHHIHLLPIVSKYVENFASSKNIPIRLIEDLSHPGSYILSKIFSLTSKSNNYFACNYLTPSDLKKSTWFALKLLHSKAKPLVIHVSTQQDFKRNSSSFEAFRNQQYLRILGYLDE